jgi:hypothetical protein
MNRRLLVLGWILLFAPTAVAAEKVRPETASAPGCGWLAERVIQTLLREDTVAARDFQEMYRAFNCPAARLADAFGCAIASGIADKPAEAKTAVAQCWRSPRRHMVKPPRPKPDSEAR